MKQQALTNFAPNLIRWQKKHGRHDLPWQNTTDPYRIWLSEIMLQQTQVDTVMGYYARFLAAFPNVEALAAAPVSRVLELWSGLGYYRRAHNLHAAAQKVAAMGGFPDTQEGLMSLPGVGRSTAAAIAVFAFGRRAAIMDGNVRRVLTRYGDNPNAKDPELWTLVENLLPKNDLVAYTQGLMDLGATVCVRGKPRCDDCPMTQDCAALAHGNTAAMPPSRAPQTITERAFCMVVAQNKDGAILLETREHETIWSGLLSLPEMSADAGKLDQLLGAFMKKNFGLTAKNIRVGKPFVHRLTHMKLSITPVHTDVIGRLKTDKNARFYAPTEAMSAGLPAPVRKILTNPLGELNLA
jgi:A/G-specific adenine glycosylase